ncbi:MAG: DUF883 family protein [Hyphomicrobiales bacterium]|nr:DUF883 family protein [Hyphomicrobiales bacterium]MBV9738854.1 DUF883 family protein [Hyphomicrobiales bacterium]
MSKDNIEGGLRKTAGQVEEFAGRATKNKQVTGEGIYDQAVGSAQSAYGQAKDTLASGASAVQKAAGNAMNEIASGDLDSLRADVTKLAQTVSQLVQNQANSTRNQITNAVGAAGDNLSQTAAMAQDRFMSMEAEMESKIKQNPLAAVGVAFGIGLLIGKMT